MGTVGRHATRIRRTLSASSLTGDRVINSAGEDLGRIKDIMIDLDTGRIAYYVVSFGGVLGVGDKLFAIPFSSTIVDQQRKAVVLNVPRELLAAAPGFDKDHWPDFGDPEFGLTIHQHYQQRPYWE